MRILLPALLAVLLVAGCDSKESQKAKPTLHPVKGKLLRGGEPVNGGYLTLRAEKNPDLIVSAKVNSDGTFEAFTVDSSERGGNRTSGAPEGTYRGEYGPPGTDQSILPVPLKEPVVIKAGDNDLTIDIGKKK